MKKFSIIPLLFVLGLAICFYINYNERLCKQFKSRFEGHIQTLTVNIIQQCPVVSLACVNNGLLFKEENLELMNTQLKDLGCK